VKEFLLPITHKNKAVVLESVDSDGLCLFVIVLFSAT
jgi:hypothetical protein